MIVTGAELVVMAYQLGVPVQVGLIKNLNIQVDWVQLPKGPGSAQEKVPTQEITTCRRCGLCDAQPDGRGSGRAAPSARFSHSTSERNFCAFRSKVRIFLRSSIACRVKRP